jgi:hypothetical protein
MLAMIENSIKPIMFVTNDFESSVDVVKAAEAAAGGAAATMFQEDTGLKLTNSALNQFNKLFEK